jgi:hypothetical protein
MPQDPQADQDFLKASPNEQHAYLMATDPGYAKAPKNEQADYFRQVTQSGPNAGLAPPAGSPASMPPMQKSLLGNDEAAFPRRSGPDKAEHIPGAFEGSYSTGDTGYGAAMSGAGLTAGAGILAPEAVKPISRFAAKHPYITNALLSGAISEARKIPYLGHIIPPMAEMLPWLRGGAEEPEPTASRPPPVTYSNRTTAEPEISNTPPPPLKWPNRIEEEAAPRQAAPPPVTYSNRIAQPETIESKAAPSPAATAAPQSIQSPIEATPTPKPKGAQTNLQQQIKDAAEPAAKQTPKAPVTNLQQQINDALGGKVPQGHTPIKSSALTSYKNNPAARELEVVTKEAGQHYIYGDVPPEAAAKFENATSKGKAWNELRKTPGVTQVATVVNGKRMPTKPPVALQSATPDDLAPEWSKAVADLKAKKASKPN